MRRFLQRKKRVQRAALDSTGLDCGHASRYYIRRRNGTQKRWQTVIYSRYAKLEAAFDCQSHLMIGVLASRGPRVDTDRFVPLLDAALGNVQMGSALADAGYDSEANHVYARRSAACGRSSRPRSGGRVPSLRAGAIGDRCGSGSTSVMADTVNGGRRKADSPCSSAVSAPWYMPALIGRSAKTCY